MNKYRLHLILLTLFSVMSLSTWAAFGAEHRSRSKSEEGDKATNAPPTNTNALAKINECNTRKGLRNSLRLMSEGSPVRIAYFGGSITAQEGWRPKTLRWFRENYPNATISQINAALGGTGSDLGVFRLRQDVLRHHPDLLFVEFAVNDGGAGPEQIERCMEGIVRQTWRSNPLTDICFVYTIAGNMLEQYEAGDVPRSVQAMERVAEHYGIPSINFGVEVTKLAKAGKLVFKGDQPRTDSEKAALKDKILFSPDAVHPYQPGHEVYLGAFVRSVPALQRKEHDIPYELKNPLRADNYEGARMVPFTRAKLSKGWQYLDPATNQIAKQFASRLPALWMASRPRETVEFKFKGTYAGVYDLLGPDCGQLIIKLDRKTFAPRPRFDSFSTYHRLGTLNIGEMLPEGVHTVKIKIDNKQPDKVKILAQRHESMNDPSRYAGTAWYASQLMLIGDLIE